MYIFYFNCVFNWVLCLLFKTLSDTPYISQNSYILVLFFFFTYMLCNNRAFGLLSPHFSTVMLANTVSDPVIEEHFRRSLGKNYKEAESLSNSVSITGSVDDHFAKALGDAWFQIKAKGGGHPPSESDP